MSTRFEQESTPSPSKSNISASRWRDFKNFTVQAVYGNPLYQTRLERQANYKVKLGEALDVDNSLASSLKASDRVSS